MGLGRASWLLTLLITCTLPWLMGADLAGPDAVRLGVTEGALTYCAPINPAVLDKLHELARQLTQGASEQQLAAVRASEAYRKAYDSVHGLVTSANERDAKRLCSKPAAEGK
jgi:hypothetical protein